MSVLTTTLRTALASFPLASFLALAQPAPANAEAVGKTTRGGLAALMETGKVGLGSAKAEDGKGGDEVQFDSDTLELDFNKRTGTFEGNVRVTDGRMLLLADKMVVYLSDKSELKQIEATGNVVISEVGQQRRAKAGMGVFDVEKDEVVLSDSPTLEDTEWTVKDAEKIVYNRGKGTFKVFKVRGVGNLDDGGRGPRDLFAPAKESEKKDKDEQKP